MSEKKTPAIRFKGFADDWEQHTVEKLTGTTYGGGTPEIDNENFWNGDIPWIQSSNTMENQLFSVNIKRYISKDGLSHSAAQLVPKNSIAVVTHVGVGKMTFMPYSYATSQDFISLSELKCNPQFLCHVLYKKLQEDLYLVQGSAIKGITKDDLMHKQVYIPESNEQNNIAAMMKDWEGIIAVYQRKLTKLQLLKKSMLTKMFPKDGARVPEIRFQGFHGDWEQRRLGDESVEIIAGGDADKSQLKSEGIYPVIANALTVNGIVGYYDNYYRVSAPAVTVTGRGDIGHAQARKINFTPVVRLLSIKSYHDVDFLSEAINRHHIILESTGVPQLTVPKLADYKIYFPPTAGEERQLGEYFSELDRLIAFYQRKLSKLQKIKQAMLSKLFV